MCINGSSTIVASEYSKLAELGRAILKVAEKIQNLTPKRKSYPSHRLCPSCGAKMVYTISKWTGHYTRKCETCGYSDGKKVRMVNQM